MKVSSVALILVGLLVGATAPPIYGAAVGITAFGILIAYGLFMSFSSGTFILFSKAWFSTAQEMNNFISVGSKIKINRCFTLFPLAVIGGIMGRFLWTTL
jgi:hypothetical protein